MASIRPRREPFPVWFERLCYLIAAGLIVSVAAFWVFDLPGSEKGRWADAMATVLLAAVVVASVVTGLATRRDREWYRSRRH